MTKTKLCLVRNKFFKSFTYKSFYIVILFLSYNYDAGAQCCSGGGGGSSAIAGDFASGVLLKNQLEFNVNFQHIHTEQFFEGTSRMDVKEYLSLPSNYLTGFDNNYLYTRMAYGLSDKLTLSVETGYYLNKTEFREGYLVDTIESKGITDLILFPRYNVYLKKTEKHHTEITAGMGLKIPLGLYNDSVLVWTDTYGIETYDTKSPAIQLSSGANDFLFSASFSRRFIPLKFSLGLNAFYIMKGWNPMQEKFGNYASVSLSATKNIVKNLSLIVQLKGEHIGVKQTQKDWMSAANLPENSGNSKLFIVPRLIYNINGPFIKQGALFISSEFPVYQNVNGIQLGSQINLSFGVIYRFLTKECEDPLPTLN
jgi:hypothetical protein